MYNIENPTMRYFSIIVPTIGRKDELVMLFESIEKQQCNNFEVILVDQNEDRELLKPVVQSFSKLFPISHVQVSGKGASYARNVGITVAEGEILLFPDDDCEFTDGLLKKVEAYFVENYNIDGICILSKDKFDGKKMGLLRSKNVKISRKNILSTVVEHGIIIRKSKLNGVKFDEQMGVGSQLSRFWSDEGPDFILRLINIGRSINFMPGLFFYHPNPTKVYNEKTAIRSYRYGLGRGYFLKKHGFSNFKLFYFCSIYLVGMLLGLLKLNKWMIKYFQRGLLGRIQGYYG